MAIFSSDKPTDTATALLRTAELMDLISSRSILGLVIGLTSITSTPSLSRCLTSSIFSRKLRLKPLPDWRIVMSVMVIFLITDSPYLGMQKSP